MTEKRRFAKAAALCALLLSSASLSQAGEPFRLGLPMVCEPGKDCFVQNYVDIDPQSGVLDVLCGTATYNGHKGTDIRLLNTKVLADVVASQEGVVRDVRNNMEDRLVLTKADRRAIANQECGNGVVLDHGGGWETQYCHMRQGSVVVSPGERVKKGQRLGLAGYSGFSSFPHIHLSVRKDGRVVDPFLGTVKAAGDRLVSCQAGGLRRMAGTGLWQTHAQQLLKDAEGALLESGFSSAPVATKELELGQVPLPTSTSTALVFYVRFINLKKGDRVLLKVRGPNGFQVVSNSDPLPGNKAQWVAFAGKKKRDPAWARGLYSGEAVLLRNGQPLFHTRSQFKIEG